MGQTTLEKKKKKREREIERDRETETERFITESIVKWTWTRSPGDPRCRVHLQRTSNNAIVQVRIHWLAALPFGYCFFWFSFSLVFRNSDNPYSTCILFRGADGREALLTS